jgi:hypothetical protein
MLNSKQILAASLAILMASASSALAGTKAQANIVPANDPTTPNPTMSTKGKLQIKDSGALSVSVKGLTDGTGAVVTTSQSWADSDFTDPNSVDGTQYMAMVKLNLVTVPAPVEYVVPIDVKKGNGSTKVNLASLMVLLDGLGNVCRSFEAQGGEVWGPLGATQLGACRAILQAGEGGLGVPGVQSQGNPDCRGGTMVGVVGINVPVAP